MAHDSGVYGLPPRPWSVGTTNEGLLCVFDANDAIVIILADMEDTTARDFDLGEFVVLASKTPVYDAVQKKAKDHHDNPPVFGRIF